MSRKSNALLRWMRDLAQDVWMWAEFAAFLIITAAVVLAAASLSQTILAP